MNKSKSLSEPIASASSSPSTSSSGTGRNSSETSSYSEVQGNSMGRGNYVPERNSPVESIGGDRTSGASEDDGEEENKDVTAR
jgi:hypothetical protein